ncbi:LPD7 domain-containing protein [Burkholderia ubonensis]|uniref:LPD7 domain-containing protein n=1 Tax=Burkholderia ubonensis TaxID=101571 RepID=UPI001160665E|nr:LPD7 domain-containing protein [Burkholderia ubonensis]
MLIRVRGGSSGIKDYLEHGQKSGREFTRDELDRRVPIVGNLAQVDRTIAAMEGSGQKYLHVTLAFKEDYLPDDVMRQVVRDVERFAFSAYKSEEYQMYAEAHLPVLKSYIHAKSGSRIERKPHIHIVVPLINMVNGMHLNPFGRVEYQERFIDALQEHVNNKYGLASPKDNPNLRFNDASEMFARYTGRELGASSDNVRDLKKDILRRVVEDRVESWDGFRALLAEYGDVRTRRAGTEREYLNLVPDPAKVGFEPVKGRTGNIKGINFDEIRFVRAAIESPTHEKFEAIGDVVRAEYFEAAASRRDPQHIASTLVHWHEVRAKEIRHIFSASADLRDRYKVAAPDEQRAMLAEQQARIDERNEQEKQYLAEALADTNTGNNDHELDRDTDPYSDAAALSDPRRAAALRQSYIAEVERRPEAESFNDLRTLSGIGMDSFTVQGPAQLLSNDAHDRLEAERAERLDSLRRRSNGEPAARAADAERGIIEDELQDLTPAELDAQLAAERPVQPGNVVEHLFREDEEARAIEAALTSMAEIRQKLDAARLLAHVSHTHGVLVDKYEVVKHHDGSDRVRCGTRHYNVSDFLTKELRMSYTQAAEPILRECYAAQQLEVDVTPIQPPTKTLWVQFKDWRNADGAVIRNAAWAAQAASERARMDALRADYRAAKQDLNREWRGKRSQSAAQQKAVELSRIRTEYAIKQTLLKADVRRERDEFKERFRFNQAYRDWLHDRAQNGDTLALKELRRQSLRQVQVERTKDRSAQLLAPANVKVSEDAVLLQHVTYQVDRWGDVTYRAQGEDLFRDERNRVAIFRHDGDTLEAALRLSIQKFGTTIALHGGDEFKRRCVEVSVQRGLKIQFSEPTLNTYADKLREDAARERATKVQRPRPIAVDPLRTIEEALAPEMRELLEMERRKLQAEQERDERRSRDNDYDPSI